MVRIKVVVRTRPERSEPTICEVYGGAGVSVHGGPQQTPTSAFTFDRAFDGRATQEEVYTATAEPFIERVLQGRNCTVLAYGPTGTGKTHTVLGTDEEPGLLPRALADLYARLDAERAASDGTTVRVVASFLEIYNERIRDLFNGDGAEGAASSLLTGGGGAAGAGEPPMRAITAPDLPVRASPDGSVRVVGLTEIECTTLEDAETCLVVGAAARAEAETGSNMNSSRSHAIFELRVETRARGSSATRTGHLLFVDLAGSECANRTGIFQEGSQRRLEASNINQSLLALGQVITALASKKAVHVPFRDSKLTRLLVDSLGGTAATVLVACVSPAQSARDETLSTLHYADKARCIEAADRVHVAPPRAPDAETLAAAERTAMEAEKALEVAIGDLAPLHAQINHADANLARSVSDAAIAAAQFEVIRAERDTELATATTEKEDLKTELARTAQRATERQAALRLEMNELEKRRELDAASRATLEAVHAAALEAERGTVVVQRTEADAALAEAAASLEALETERGALKRRVAEAEAAAAEAREAHSTEVRRQAKEFESRLGAAAAAHAVVLELVAEDKGAAEEALAAARAEGAAARAAARKEAAEQQDAQDEATAALWAVADGTAADCASRLAMAQAEVASLKDDLDRSARRARDACAQLKDACEAEAEATAKLDGARRSHAAKQKDLLGALSEAKQHARTKFAEREKAFDAEREASQRRHAEALAGLCAKLDAAVSEANARADQHLAAVEARHAADLVETARAAAVKARAQAKASEAETLEAQRAAFDRERAEFADRAAADQAAQATRLTAALKAELEDLRARAVADEAKAERRRHQVERDLAEARAAAAAQAERNGALGQSVAVLETELATLQARVLAADDDKRRLGDEVAEARNLADDHFAENRRLVEKYAKHAADLAHVMAEVAEARNFADDHAAENKRLVEKDAQHAADLARVMAEVAEARNFADDHAAENKRLVEKDAKHAADLARVMAEVAEARNFADDHAAENKRLVEKDAKHAADLARVMAEVAEARNFADDHAAENKRLVEKDAQHAADLARVMAEVAEARNFADDHAAENKRLVEKDAKHAADLARVMAEVAEARNFADDHAAENKRLVEKDAKHAADLARVMAEVAEARNFADDHAAENKRLVEKDAQHAADLARVMAEVAEARNFADDHAAENKRLVEKDAKHAADLARVMAEVAEARNFADDHAAENKRLVEKDAKHAADLARVMAEVAEARNLADDHAAENKRLAEKDAQHAADLTRAMTGHAAQCEGLRRDLETAWDQAAADLDAERAKAAKALVDLGPQLASQHAAGLLEGAQRAKVAEAEQCAALIATAVDRAVAKAVRDAETRGAHKLERLATQHAAQTKSLEKAHTTARLELEKAHALELDFLRTQADAALSTYHVPAGEEEPGRGAIHQTVDISEDEQKPNLPPKAKKPITRRASRHIEPQQQQQTPAATVKAATAQEHKENAAEPAASKSAASKADGVEYRTNLRRSTRAKKPLSSVTNLG